MTCIVRQKNIFGERSLATAHSRLLVHGGSSGIGTTAIQMAATNGVRVIATAGSDVKCAAIERLGCTAINYKSESFEDRVRELTRGEGVDLILDMVGGEYVNRNLRLLKMQGRLAVIGSLGGTSAEVDLRYAMCNRITVGGSTIRAQSRANKGRIADDLRQFVWPRLESREI